MVVCPNEFCKSPGDLLERQNCWNMRIVAQVTHSFSFDAFRNTVRFLRIQCNLDTTK